MTCRRRTCPILIGAFVALAMMSIAGVFAWASSERARGLAQDKLVAEMGRMAAEAALQVDPVAHGRLVSAGQLGSAEYLSVSSRLEQFLRRYPDVVYVYTLRRIDGRFYFIVDPTVSGDSDGDGVDDKSYLMEEYREADAELTQSWVSGQVVVTEAPHTDRWGTFVTAYAPVFRADGELDSVVGVDVRYDRYQAILQEIGQQQTDWLAGAFFLSSLAGLVTWAGAGALQRSLARMATHQSELGEINERLRTQAWTDGLTGLLNREGLAEAFREREAGGADVTTGSVVFIDLDHFKSVNDAGGHEAGDELLVEVSRRLCGLVGGGALARFGGDEFVAVFWGDEGGHLARSFVEDAMQAVGARLSAGGRDHWPSFSAGVAVWGAESGSLGAAVKRADLAMYAAKEQGAGRWSDYVPAMEETAIRRALLEDSLRGALDRGEMWMAWQPVVDLPSGHVRGAEGLLRWTTSEGRVVSPAEFIPVAEASGLVVALGDFVLEEVCRRLAAWSGDRCLGGLRLGVNVSVRQIAQDDFVEKVLGALERHGADPRRLTLEVTESLIVSDVAVYTARLQRLRLAGVRIAMDDFGTGYSSLSMLVNLPVDILKIDRSFVSSLLEDERSGTLTRVLLSLAHELDLDTVAEGVETDEQAAALRFLGCGSGQGWLFAKAMGVAEFEVWIGGRSVGEVAA